MRFWSKAKSIACSRCSTKADLEAFKEHAARDLRRRSEVGNRGRPPEGRCYFRKRGTLPGVLV